MTLAEFLIQFPHVSLDKEQQVLHLENYYCMLPGGKGYLGHLDFLFIKKKCILYVTLPNKKRFFIKKINTFKLNELRWEKKNSRGFILYDMRNIKKTFICWAT